MIHGLEYKGETKGKICVICKLPFGNNQKILFCPNCESLFHEEHLVSWLSNHTNCPICARDFSKEIEKYSLGDYNDDSNQVEIIQSTNLPKSELKLKNTDIIRHPRITQFAMTILGIPLIFISVCLIPLLIPYPMVLLCSLFGCVLYIMGLFMIRYAFVRLRNE